MDNSKVEGQKLCVHCNDGGANGKNAGARGIITERPEKIVKDITLRLNRIEGQVKGVNDMISQGRYCDDVLSQISAIQSALSSVGKILLENHIKTCITRRLRDGDGEAVDELMKTLKRML
ncbi:MAG: metal-sensing transcriptional repressor [Clostridiales bacterium]|jgi:DNA-binding FrmR family transcriptional regulator|nr:metal-sensing transcriptional repressor [Clostridiales bacterium]